MPVRETLLLDLSQALGQIDDLERELDALFQPIVIPVDIESDQSLAELQRDIQAVDNDDIDVDVNARGVSEAERSIERLAEEFEDAEESAEDYARAVDRAEDETDKLGRTGKTAFSGLSKSLVGLAAAFGGIAALRGVADFFGESIQSASDLEESTGKAQIVFGEFFTDIQRFASTAPQALGLSNQAALEFTGTFGNLFTALGLSQQAAADLSPDIVQLGADLAAFNNIDTSEALDKLRAGLVGEAEPLRSLGVSLSAARVEAKALELGLGSVTGEVDDAAKVQARYALILEDTVNAQGNFADTSDDIAGTQKQLSAAFENLRADIGTALIPAFQAIIEAGPAIIETIESLIPALKDLADTVASFDFAGAVSGLRTFGNTASGVFSFFQGDAVSFEISGFINDLTASLDAGIEPARAFDAVLAQLIDKRLGSGLGGFADVDDIRRLVRELQGFADLDDAELINLLATIERLGESVGLSEIEIEGITLELRELAGLAGAIPPPVNELADAFADVPPVADAAAVALTDFGDSLSRVVSEDFDFNTTAIRAGLAELPDLFSGAAEALRDEEGDIIDDFNLFLENFDGILEARRDFRRNIAFLRALGLDNLADIFEDAGIDAAPALQDGINQGVDALTSQNQAFQDLANRDAQDYATAFGTDVGEFLANLSPPEFEVTPVLGPLNTGSLDSSFLSINVGANAPGFGVGGTTVYQEFNGVPGPTPETERAAQAANAIINSGGPQ